MVVLKVEGMTCGGCAASVERAILRADPFAKVKIDLTTGRVEAESRASATELAAAVKAAGYDAATA